MISLISATAAEPEFQKGNKADPNINKFLGEGVREIIGGWIFSFS